MKILQINSVCGIKSTGRIATDLYDAIHSSGGSCKIAYGRETAQNIAPEDAYRVGSDRDVRLHGLCSRLTDKTGFYSKTATIRLVEYIKEYNPDLIHLHNLHGYYLHLPTLFAYLKAADKPVVWTLHDCWSFTGHCAHFDYIGCDRWKTACHDCPQRAEYPKSLLADNSAENYRQKRELFTSVPELHLICPSKWLLELTRQSFLAEVPAVHISNGVDLRVFKPSPSDFRETYGLAGKTILLAVASVWTPHKGLEDILRLSRALTENEKLVIVGLTERQRAQLPSGVLGITHTNDAAALAGIYSACDIFVNPTKEETLGLVNIEALACGTPVITYDSGGSPECLDADCGAVVPRDDSTALLKAARALLAEPPAAACCVSFAQQFNKESVYPRYIALYRRILGQSVKP